MAFTTTRRAVLAAATAALMLAGPAGAPALAADKMLDSVHFLIPGGAGGGWDGTARGTGEALTKAGLVGSGLLREHVRRRRRQGDRLYLIENAESNQGTLMVNSTPIVIRR